MAQRYEKQVKIEKPFLNFDEICIPRRQFVKGMAMGGALLGLGLSPARLLATADTLSGQPTLLSKRFDLTIAPHAVNFTGRERKATAVNGLVQEPVLRWREGDRAVRTGHY